jgi:two-component system, sensor histidine kinase and response regulator
MRPPESTDIGVEEFRQTPATLRAEILAANLGADAARQTARSVSTARAVFLANMARAIRTSVAAMLGHAQLLEMGLAAQGDVVERLRGSGTRLMTLLDDVLALSKLESGRTFVAQEHAVTADSVAAALLLTLGQAEARGVRVVDAGGDARGVAYVGDERRVREILVTLLETAAQLSPVGGSVAVHCATTDQPSARAHVVGAGPWTSIRVEGSGGGLAAIVRAGTFEPFRGFDVSVAGAKHDLGLGLAISQSLARLMGGDLTIENERGDESALTLWLPAAADGEGAPERAARARTLGV